MEIITFKYYFKSDEKTAFFTININVPKYTGYLSIKVFKGNDEIHLPNWLLVILVISGFLLYILYLVALGYICLRNIVILSEDYRYFLYLYY